MASSASRAGGMGLVARQNQMVRPATRTPRATRPAMARFTRRVEDSSPTLAATEVGVVTVSAPPITAGTTVVVEAAAVVAAALTVVAWGSRSSTGRAATTTAPRCAAGEDSGAPAAAT